MEILVPLTARIITPHSSYKRLRTEGLTIPLAHAEVPGSEGITVRTSKGLGSHLPVIHINLFINCINQVIHPAFGKEILLLKLLRVSHNQG